MLVLFGDGCYDLGMIKQTDFAMHVAKIVCRPKNGRAYTSYLLRHNYREDGKVKHRTIANLSSLPVHKIEAIAAALRGDVLMNLADLQIRRSLPHGNVVSVLGTLRSLGVERLIDRSPSRQRDLVVGMIASRLLTPGSKLETTRRWNQSTLASTLGIEDANEDELYRAMDWLVAKQDKIENALAKRHLTNGSLVLYDLSSSYVEGVCCPIAKIGYSRDGKRNTLQIEYGVLTDEKGRPVATEVFEGNMSDPKTVESQVDKITKRFGLSDVIFVGDRGMVTSSNIEKLRAIGGLTWITALRHAQIRSLLQEGAFQLSLFEEKDLAEITSPEYPGERLVVCRNPLLMEKAAHTRESLLAATEAKFRPITEAVQSGKLTDAAKIGLKVGRIINARKVARYFTVVIAEGQLTITRRTDEIAADALLDGVYAIRTSVPLEKMETDDVVRTYKRLQNVENAFRHFKSVDLQVRPIRHYAEQRVRAHLFLCMLAYYLQWEMERCWAPMLFRDEHPVPQKNPVRAVKKPAPPARIDGVPTHSFRTLLSEMATLTRNAVVPAVEGDDTPFEITATPTDEQSRALALLSLNTTL